MWLTNCPGCVGNLPLSSSYPESAIGLPLRWSTKSQDGTTHEASFTTDDTLPRRPPTLKAQHSLPEYIPTVSSSDLEADAIPSTSQKQDALSRAIMLSKKLWSSNIPSHVNDNGDLMLDMTGYKSSEEDSLRAEVIARQILSEELEGNYDIGSLIGADEKGNLWIYSSEEAKEAAARKLAFSVMQPTALASADAVSDPGYQSDDSQSHKSLDLLSSRARRESDSAVALSTPPDSPLQQASDELSKSYAKTLRLSSDQLKTLGLKSGPNPISFSVNRATCSAYIYLWKQEVPIVISDIDGTITKSATTAHPQMTIQLTLLQIRCTRPCLEYDRPRLDTSRSC